MKNFLYCVQFHLLIYLKILFQRSSPFVSIRSTMIALKFFVITLTTEALEAKCRDFSCSWVNLFLLLNQSTVCLHASAHDSEEKSEMDYTLDGAYDDGRNRKSNGEKNKINESEFGKKMENTHSGFDGTIGVSGLFDGAELLGCKATDVLELLEKEHYAAFEKNKNKNKKIELKNFEKKNFENEMVKNSFGKELVSFLETFEGGCKRHEILIHSFIILHGF